MLGLDGVELWNNDQITSSESHYLRKISIHIIKTCNSSQDTFTKSPNVTLTRAADIDILVCISSHGFCH